MRSSVYILSPTSATVRLNVVRDGAMHAEVAPEYAGGSYVEGQNAILRSFDNGKVQGPQRMQASVQMPRQSMGPGHSAATTPGSFPRRPDSSHGPSSRKSVARPRNGQRNGNSGKVLPACSTFANTLSSVTFSPGVVDRHWIVYQ